MSQGTPPWRDGEPPVACPRGCGHGVHWNPCERAETETMAVLTEAFRLATATAYRADRKSKPGLTPFPPHNHLSQGEEEGAIPGQDLPSADPTSPACRHVSVFG